MKDKENKVINIKVNTNYGMLILYFSVDVLYVKIQNFKTHQQYLHKTFGRKEIVLGYLKEGIYIVSLYKKNKLNKKINYIKYKIKMPYCEYMKVYF